MNTITCDEVRELAAAYVLDGLSFSDAAAVRDHLAAHPDAHPEFAELAGVAPALAHLSDPVAPPPALKGRLLAAAAATGPPAPAPRPAQAQPAPGRPATAVEPDEHRRQPVEVARDTGWAVRPRRVAIVRWAFSAAAVLVIAGLVFANLSLQRDVSNARQFTDQLQRAVSLASVPGSRVAIIAASVGSRGAAAPASPAGPGGMAVIGQGGSGILVMQGLGPTAGSQVYEAWAIVGSQAPAPIGSFSVGGDGLGWLAELTVPPGDGVTVALTKEPGPGATTPTLPVVAAGTAAPHS